MVEFFKEGLREMLGGGVDLVFCNEAEAKGWADTDDLDTAIGELKKIARTFAITLGAAGALVYDGSELSRIEPHTVKAIDTNGAGDMFAGAFLYGITHGFSFREAGELASLASAQVVAQYGPRLDPIQHRGLLDTYVLQKEAG